MDYLTPFGTRSKGVGMNHPSSDPGWQMFSTAREICKLLTEVIKSTRAKFFVFQSADVFR